MNNVIARMYDFFDYLFNHDVIKERKEEQEQYENAIIKIGELESDIDLLKASRDRYLKNCKQKTEEIKKLKKKIKELEMLGGNVS